MKYRVNMLMLAAITGFLYLGIIPAAAQAEKKIGVFIWSDEARYAQSRDGIVDQLKKEGFSGKNVSFTTENAGGSKVKAMEIARKFASGKYDMVIAVGTSAVVAAASEIRNIPLVFSMVYDPVDSKIAKDWSSSGNNTTGASPKVPMGQLVEALKKMAPVKTLGILYTPGEKNSETQLKEMMAAANQAQIKVTPVPLTNKAALPSLMPDVAARVSALYLTGSSIVGEAFDTIIQMAAKTKMITLSHLEDHVERGALLGVTADPRAVGVLAGAKAAKILKGAKPSSLPIETVKRFDVLINLKTAKASQISVPDAFLKSATRVIE